MSRITMVLTMVLLFTFSAQAAPKIPFTPATCTSSSADAYKKIMKVTNAAMEAQRNKQFFQSTPELKKLLDRSGLKLKAQAPTKDEINKAADAAAKSDEICAAETAVAQKKIEDKKKQLEGQIKTLQAEISKLGEKK